MKIIIIYYRKNVDIINSKTKMRDIMEVLKYILEEGG
jgi:hypothetical protein